MAKQNLSPLTGVIEEENVVIDFGEHVGKSVLQLWDENPDYYDFLIAEKDEGRYIIKRNRDKIYKLYENTTLQ